MIKPYIIGFAQTVIEYEYFWSRKQPTQKLEENINFYTHMNIYMHKSRMPRACARYTCSKCIQVVYMLLY